jgi:hypothetical protein
MVQTSIYTLLDRMKKCLVSPIFLDKSITSFSASARIY